MYIFQGFPSSITIFILVLLPGSVTQEYTKTIYFLTVIPDGSLTSVIPCHQYWSTPMTEVPLAFISPIFKSPLKVVALYLYIFLTSCENLSMTNRDNCKAAEIKNRSHELGTKCFPLDIKGICWVTGSSIYSTT